jgi:hypothetical protein
LVKRYQHRPAEELYDLRDDPHELRNVAAQADNRDLVVSLRARLTAWMTAQGDQGIATEMKAFQRQGRKPKQTTPGKPKNGEPDKRRYVLAQGDVLEGQSAPPVGGRGFQLEASLESTAPEGVILAQGAKAYGYALLVRDRRLMLAVSEKRQVSTVTAADPLSPGEHVVVARLAPDGTMSLAVDGNEVATGKAPGPLSATPKDGLHVGCDLGNAVLPDYDPPNRFRGKVHRVVLTLEE